MIKGLVLWFLGVALTWLALLGGIASSFAGLGVLLVGWVAYRVSLAVSAALDTRRARATKVSEGRWWALAALVLLQVALGSLPPRSWLPIQSFRIRFSSMEPTIQGGDALMADVRAWNYHQPERGDLVIHRGPKEPEHSFVRRVIGLPGERIEIRDKRVYIDGKPIDDPWAIHSDSRTYSDSPHSPPMMRARDQFGPLMVPDGAVFLLGDNRDNSRDSRFIGPIDRSLLLGRPLYIYWSRDLDRIGRTLR
jgi:signal peptidase I